MPEPDCAQSFVGSREVDGGLEGGSDRVDAYEKLIGEGEESYHVRVQVCMARVRAAMFLLPCCWLRKVQSAEDHVRTVSEKVVSLP